MKSEYKMKPKTTTVIRLVRIVSVHEDPSIYSVIDFDQFVLTCFFVYLSSTGRYIYFDAAQSKEKARFFTPSSIRSYKCLKFHYHMTGAHSGRLNVYATDIRGKEQLLWRLFGEQKNTWREASIPVNDIHPQYQVYFNDFYNTEVLTTNELGLSSIFGHNFYLFRKQLRDYVHSHAGR